MNNEANSMNVPQCPKCHLPVRKENRHGSFWYVCDVEEKGCRASGRWDKRVKELIIEPAHENIVLHQEWTLGKPTRCRLVPSEEVEKAYLEGTEAVLNGVIRENKTVRELWLSSRAKKVAEGMQPSIETTNQT